MQRYYAARAAEYESIYAKPERQADLRALEAWVTRQCVDRHGLEIACGTGYWTQFAVPACTRWCATDVNEPVLEIARNKPALVLAQADGRLGFAHADAYAMDVPDGAYDLALAAFWWSHVERDRLAAWLARLHRALAPGAMVIFIDNRYVEGSSTPVARRDARGNTYQQRLLADGSRHEVLKNFPSRDEALGAIGPLAADARWYEDWRHFWALRYTVARGDVAQP